MKKFSTIAGLLFFIAIAAWSQVPTITITSPKSGDEYRVGRTVAIKWDTTGTRGLTFKFSSSESLNGPWQALPLPKDATEFKDQTADGTKAVGQVLTVLPYKATNNLYIKMELKDEATVYGTVGPIKIKVPSPSVVDSTITGTITGSVTLSSSKIYGLKGIVFVAEGGVLRIEPGTIILGEVGATSAICVNRGGKIYANGTAEKPIIMTSGAIPGQRDRGDWGGLLIMGRAKTNTVEAPIEGGIADGPDKKVNAWYGGNDDEDSSGVLRYVRIEFAGIAISPDNELNSLTMGGVGSRTVIDHIQVSYCGDDGIECFGGTVNVKHVIAFNTIDDDFDTDNGYRGKWQFGLIKRFSDIADQSNSEAFESDNDSKSSENQPLTAPVYSNITVIGPVKDLSWTAGSGANTYNTKYLTAVQIRRNSRLSLYNSVILGWPRGVEMTNQNTVRGANNDSTRVRYNSIYGIKDEARNFYFGSGTVAEGKVQANWLSGVEPGNTLTNGAGNVGGLAKISNAFPAEMQLLDPSPSANAEYLNSSNFSADGVVPINDAFFTKVAYRGAFAVGERWDLPWAEYDPVNAEYKASSVREDNISNQMSFFVYPSPAQSYVNISFSIPSDSHVSIKIFDVYGNLVKEISNEYKVAGPYSFSVNINELVSGAYFLHIQTDQGYGVKPISIIK